MPPLAVFIIAILVIAILAMIGLVLYQSVFLFIAARGPTYVPTADDKLAAMLTLCDHISTPVSRVADLGSGDGKVILALAHRFPRVEIHGYEINPFLVRRSRKAIAAAGFSDRVHIHQKSFWDVDYSLYDVLFIYFNAFTIRSFEQTLMREKKRGVHIISNYFRFEHQTPVRSLNDVHHYELP